MGLSEAEFWDLEPRRWRLLWDRHIERIYREQLTAAIPAAAILNALAPRGSRPIRPEDIVRRPAPPRPEDLQRRVMAAAHVLGGRIERG